MIQKFKRLLVHPWVALVVIRRALYSFTQGDLTKESRRRMAVINAAFDEALDPEEVGNNVANPFNRVSKHDLEKHTKKNEELVEKYGSDARFKADEGYHPMPAPELRVTIDLSPEDLRVVENAVDTFAKRPEATRDLDRGFAAVWDAIAEAKDVEVDTSRLRTVGGPE